MTVFEKIEAQQKGLDEGDPIWMVGEQLKDICQDPECAAIVVEDLESEAMSLQNAERKLKEYADDLNKKQKNRSVCIPPNVADRIIREFYGLPAAAPAKPTVSAEEPKTAMPDLFSFF